MQNAERIDRGLGRVSSIGCVVCGGKEAKLLWKERLPETIDASQFSYKGNKKFHGRIVECSDCRHRYVAPIPMCADSFYAAVEDEFYLETEEYRVQTFAEFLDFKERFAPKRGSLLDIGCYTGVFLSVAKKRGYSVAGTELSSWAAGIARSRGFDVVELPVEQLDEQEQFDNISAFDVFEHLEDPRSAAEIVCKKLKKGGCFFATVPDMHSWHTKILGEHHWLVILMHYHYFNARNFRSMLLSAGFSRVDVYQSPPYRLPLNRVRNWAKGTPLSFIFQILGRLPIVRNLEIRLRASLYAICYND